MSLLDEQAKKDARVLAKAKKIQTTMKNNPIHNLAVKTELRRMTTKAKPAANNVRTYSVGKKK